MVNQDWRDLLRHNGIFCTKIAFGHKAFSWKSSKVLVTSNILFFSDWLLKSTHLLLPYDFESVKKSSVRGQPQCKSRLQFEKLTGDGVCLVCNCHRLRLPIRKWCLRTAHVLLTKHVSYKVLHYAAHLLRCAQSHFSDKRTLTRYATCGRS